MAVFNAEDCATHRAPGRMLRRIDKIMSAYVEAKFEALDLTLMQWVALKVVRDGVVSNAGELARELGFTTGAITRLIDALETRGLMTRERCGGDRRVVQLATTPAGREAVLALQNHVVTAWNEVLADFTQEEADTLILLLMKLMAAAENISGGMPQIRENEE